MPIRVPSSPADTLSLAEMWAREMGKRVRMVEVTDQDGSKGPVLLVSHVDRQLFIQALGSCIRVTLLIDIPSEVAEAIARAPAATRKRIDVNLRYELTSNARTAYTLRPRTMSDLTQLRRITVEQLIRISEEDPASFNRFADAIQEVVTTAVRASEVLAPFLPTGGGPSNITDDGAFPSNMYV